MFDTNADLLEPAQFQRREDFWVQNKVIIPEKAKLIRDKRNGTLREARTRQALAHSAEGIEGWAKTWTELKAAAPVKAEQIRKVALEIQEKAGPQWR